MIFYKYAAPLALICRPTRTENSVRMLWWIRRQDVPQHGGGGENLVTAFQGELKFSSSRLSPKTAQRQDLWVGAPLGGIEFADFQQHIIISNSCLISRAAVHDMSDIVIALQIVAQKQRLDDYVRKAEALFF